MMEWIAVGKFELDIDWWSRRCASCVIAVIIRRTMELERASVVQGVLTNEDL
jgi:ribosomal protein S19E (S16A)